MFYSISSAQSCFEHTSSVSYLKLKKKLKFSFAMPTSCKYIVPTGIVSNANKIVMVSQSSILWFRVISRIFYGLLANFRILDSILRLHYLCKHFTMVKPFWLWMLFKEKPKWWFSDIFILSQHTCVSQHTHLHSFLTPRSQNRNIEFI